MADFQVKEVEKGKKYYVRMDLGKDARGKRLRPNYTVNGTYQDAQAKGYKLLREHRENTFTLPQKITVEQAINAYLADRKSNLSKRTLKEQTSRFRLYIFPTIGKMRLQAVTPYDVEKVLLDMNARGLSYNTQRLVRTNLNKFWKYARKRGWVMRNIIEDVDLPSRNNGEQIEFIAPRKFEVFIKATRTLDDKNLLVGVLLRTLIRTGLRISEAMALTWTDVDLGEHVIKVNRASEWLDRSWQAKLTPKNRSSRRNVPVDKKVSKDLVALRPDTYKLSDRIFQDAKGKQPCYETLRDSLVRVLVGAKLPQMGLHSLRHSYATYMLASKELQMHEVSRLLGHSSIKITVDTYGHIDFSDLQEKVKMVSVPHGISRTETPRLIRADKATHDVKVDKMLDKNEST